MNVLDLFSGIGGFSLGLERAGMRTVAFCEIDPLCRRVLAKHWPDVPIYDDVRTLTVHQGWLVSHADERREPTQEELRPRRQGIRSDSLDVICGGFPCQDISIAGKGAGIGGKRSGLWSEFARIIGEVRPRYVIVENVAALLGRGIERVLGDLATLGFDAEWHCIPASAVGAPHRRDRIWIVANPQSEGLEGRQQSATSRQTFSIVAGSGEPNVANADAGWKLQSQRRLRDIGRWFGDGSWWSSEPDVGRVAYGVPARVDRLRCLGNAVVPQIPEIIGRAIMNIAIEKGCG